MKRDVFQYLIEWKDRADRKPLIVRGARQVGKTYIIEAFGREFFDNYLKVNLEERPELCKLFESNYSQIVLSELSIIFNIDVVEGKTLVFIDEIQACPKALVFLRYLYEQAPGLHVIAAGSLLDHALNEIQYTMPVGRVEFCYMSPLSFNEFLNAIGQSRMVSYIKSFDFASDFSSVIHQKILEFVRLFYFIGGMPEAVNSYAQNGSLVSIERIHSSIITSLRYDFAKYGTKKQQEYLAKVMNYCAINQSRKVKYTNVDQGTRSHNLKEAFLKLEMSRIINLVKHSSSSKVPIGEGVDSNVFKPLFLDIGLANHISGIQLVDFEKLITANEGGLAEQFVGQEFIAVNKPYIDPNLFYWIREEKNSNAEIDYIFQHANNLYPVEVKAGKSGTLRSLHVYLFEKKLKTGVRFNTDLPSIGSFHASLNLKDAKNPMEYTLISLPIYMASEAHRLLDIVSRRGNA
jgi:hypothetical protein